MGRIMVSSICGGAPSTSCNGERMSLYRVGGLSCSLEWLGSAVYNCSPVYLLCVPEVQIASLVALFNYIWLEWLSLECIFAKRGGAGYLQKETCWPRITSATSSLMLFPIAGF